ncbi:M48 family metallopeptidase [Mangrovibacterium lignilyticum]|uniref:M48 family metallopeptidase n=1 Tax=Mangrovibacterium lignilyticum TaxID=2668052 RepID=UPI0013D4C880|nr:M48 family metallopeptidase [Mangrovibacterium lignilyticum]
MSPKIDYRITTKERVYFYIRLFFSLPMYILITAGIYMSFKTANPQMASLYVLYFYLGAILIYLFFRLGVLIGYLKGNAIKLSKDQFPDIYKVAQLQAEQLGLKSVPSIYILQSGGMLNAFAARFMGSNYVVLYSEIVEAAYQQDRAMLEFIIGHELGHIKRRHMQKNLLLMPSFLIPFLGAAYSRACEYTCDNIGHALCPSGVQSGLLVLASGKTIYRKVNLKAYLRQDTSEDGFWKWFAEKVSTHPNLTKRLAVFTDVRKLNTGKSRLQIIEETVTEAPVEEKKEDDYSRYMPQ